MQRLQPLRARLAKASDATHEDQIKVLRERATRVVDEVYLDPEPSVSEWLRVLLPTRPAALQYFHNIFPCVGWLPRYNRAWLLGDSIAGLTVGLVVIPQAMAYALLARLSPEYGLYTSFTGAVCYWLFGTSRDIVIGTTAVGSLLVGSAVSHVESERPGMYSAAEIAATLSLLNGCVLLLVGLLRLGWIVDFIPYISISAFVTAAAITIMSTQLPVLLGINGIDTHQAAYKVLLATLKKLPQADLNSAIGVSSLVLLFVIKYTFEKLAERQPSKKRLWTMINSLRFTFTILLYTLISFLVHRNGAVRKFRIVGTIPVGFKNAKVPVLKSELIGVIVRDLPAILIILVIEHIAIAKSFGRMYGYTIVPSQEILAQGLANLFSPFVGGYVCTGSFGASAVLSKAGTRTPLAGLFSALVLILALYALTAVFFYIPLASLAGLILHATYNLITPPKSLYKYWQLSPWDLLIWLAGLFTAVFVSLEISIYLTIGLSAGLLLVRLARTKGSFLGRVRMHIAIEHDVTTQAAKASDPSQTSPRVISSDINCKTPRSADIYLSLARDDGANPDVELHSPHPGIFVYRFAEAFTYISQGQHAERIVSYIKQHTSPTTTEDPSALPSDRLWNDPGPRKTGRDEPLADGISSSASSATALEEPEWPHLRAVVLDCSAINNIDVTSVQGLVDLRAVLDRHAAPRPVEWHFANLRNRWTRRALATAGFGFPTIDNAAALAQWTPAYAVVGSAAIVHQEAPLALEDDEEKGDSADHAETANCRRTVFGIDKPFFHADLNTAVDSAVTNVSSSLAPCGNLR